MDKEIAIKITVQDAELIMKTLIKLPYEQVAKLIMTFDAQVRSQLSEEPTNV